MQTHMIKYTNPNTTKELVVKRLIALNTNRVLKFENYQEFYESEY